LHANYIQTIFFFSLREQKSFGRNRRIETTRHITAATIIFLLWGGRKKKKKKKKHLKILENQIKKKKKMKGTKQITQSSGFPTTVGAEACWIYTGWKYSPNLMQWPTIKHEAVMAGT
jgi:hypothetical protein